MLLYVEESFNALPVKDIKAGKSLRRSINFLKKQIQELNLDMVTITKAEFSVQVDRLTSIKGIGNGVATALIMATGGFTYFDSATSSPEHRLKQKV